MTLDSQIRKWASLVQEDVQVQESHTDEEKEFLRKALEAYFHASSQFQKIEIDFRGNIVMDFEYSESPDSEHSSQLAYEDQFRSFKNEIEKILQTWNEINHTNFKVEDKYDADHDISYLSIS